MDRASVLTRDVALVALQCCGVLIFEKCLSMDGLGVMCLVIHTRGSGLVAITSLRATKESGKVFIDGWSGSDVFGDTRERVRPGGHHLAPGDKRGRRTVNNRA